MIFLRMPATSLAPGPAGHHFSPLKKPFMSTQTTPKPIPGFFVGKLVTEERINNYINQKHGLLSDGIGKDDTQSIWYSRDHFAELLEEIDYANGDGVRIHFGMYEEGHEFEGQLCLLFTSTKEVLDGEIVTHQNVLLEDQEDWEDRSTAARGNPNVANDGRKKDFNYGSPCPPRCPGFTGGIAYP
jgi:hypothetical protein